ncbi:MAG TPA: hypothetical protein PLY66_08525 [Acidobacteriota bacterium]|nr:hypothetical protein [Acidobacteriota bacterium]HQF88275.1 hypothetical protein [Acidobacteriota bacterium]HQG92412.1 hypothetical protein [Acidobacteriota bacterium]
MLWFRWSFALLVTLIPFVILAESASAAGPEQWLAAPAGWQPSGKVELYAPESLYKYINGAAESYLSCNFRMLAVQNYSRKGGATATVEIYQHASPADAFGIYSQERPPSGFFMAIGAEGYGDIITLNFFKGDCYVKITVDGAGKEGPVVLDMFGKAVAERIPGPARFPELVRRLPEAGRKAHTEKYIAQNFLGYQYLRGAYIAEYLLKGQNLQGFVMDCGDAESAHAVVARFAFGGNAPAGALDAGGKAFRDKYNGDIQLGWRGRFVWGSTGGDATQRQALAASIAKSLKAGQLIQ